MSKPRPVRLFTSYADRDQDLKKQLDMHLALLRRQGLVELWGERPLAASQPYAGVIDDNLLTADIVLLLLTPSFLASDYCYEGEMASAMELHRKGALRVIPILGKTVDLTGAPFSNLQGLPTNNKPINKWADGDEAWVNVVRGLRQVVQVMAAQPARVASAQATATTATAQDPATAPSAVDPRQLYMQLEQLTQVQFDKVLFWTQVPPAYLPAESAPQATRAMALVRHFQQKGETGLLSLESTIRQAIRQESR